MSKTLKEIILMMLYRTFNCEYANLENRTGSFSAMTDDAIKVDVVIGSGAIDGIQHDLETVSINLTDTVTGETQSFILEAKPKIQE